MTAIPAEWKPLVATFMEWNAKLNLSAIRKAEDIYIKHILDALAVLEKITFEDDTSLADIGTGGGFPLLPLATLFPKVRCTGIDARKKKTLAVQEIAESLQLDNVRTLRSRAEDVKEKYDYVTARSVGFADKIVPWAAPLVKKGGTLILYKILSSEEEPILLDIADQHLLDLETMHYYKLFEEDIQRVLYIFTKR